MLCSNSPACCVLIEKTVQERRKDRGQDQSQDPNRFGVYRERAGNDCEAGKSDEFRHATHSESNNYADNNLLHDMPFSSCDRTKARTHPLIWRDCLKPRL